MKSSLSQEPKRTPIIAVLLSSLLISALYGVVSGILWSFALDVEIKYGMINGCMVGMGLGVLFFLFQRAITGSGRIEDKEGSFVAGSFMGVLLLLSLAAALLTWLWRWIAL